jgi:hypothetical protein
MIDIFFSCFTIIYFLFLISNISKFSTKNVSRSTCEEIIYGLIIVSFLALLINFFFPLTPELNFLIFCIIILISIYKKIFFINKQKLVTFLLISLLSTLFLLLSESYRPDAGLYHYPYIKILNEEKIIFGLSNLHMRFGHISILQYQSAFFNNLIIGANGIVIPLSIIASTTIFFICKEIFNSLKKRDNKIDIFFYFFILVFISFKMNRYSEFGNDAPAHFILFFLTVVFIKNFKTKEKFGDICFLSVFILLNKITLATAILLPLFHLIANKLKLKQILNFRSIFSVVFLFIWLLKNFFVSSCLVFPIKITCFENVSWSKNSSKIYKYSVGTEAFAKGLPDQNDKDYLKSEIFYKNFNWFSTWFKNHFMDKVFKNMGIYIVILLLCFFFLKIKFSKIYETNIKYDKSDIRPYFYILIMAILGTFIWFLKAPVFRFGYSYLTLLISSIILIILAMVLTKKKVVFNLISFKFLIVLCIFGIILKQLVRIENRSVNTYFNYPWVKFYSSDNENNPTTNKTIKYNNIIVYRIPNADDQLCFFSKSICVPPNEVQKKIDFQTIKSYKFFTSK